MAEQLELNQSDKAVMNEFFRMKRENNKVLLLGAQSLANITGFSRPRAYAVLTSLEERGILIKIERKGFTLSEKGENILNEFEHRLKILETYFHSDIGLSVDEASKEANNLVLHVSPKFVDKLCKKMDKPLYCPHNYKIPHDDVLAD